MNTREVANPLRMDCYLSIGFDGVFASDCIPTMCDPKCAMVLNTDPQDQEGEHWVCIYIENGVGEYFDSYGLPPLIKSFQEFLDKNCGPNGWTYNTKAFQAMDSDVCGHYCMWFLGERARGRTMDDIKRQFSKNCKKNDKLVKRWVEQRYGEIAARYSADAIENAGGVGDGDCGGICQHCCARMNCVRFANVCQSHCSS
jgi:hypothetical protein